jgi:hypothetical protein
MFKTVSALLAAFTLLAPSDALAGGAGTTTAEPLRMARPARDMGMGEAQAATGTGPGSIASNPAGLVDTRLATLHFTHVLAVAGTQQEYLAWAQRIPFGPALGLSVFWMYNNGTERTLEDESGDYAGKAGEYAVVFGGVSAAAAIDLKELTGLDLLRPTAGAAFRAFSQQIDDIKDSGVALDLGFRLRPGFGFSLAGVLQNAGRKVAGAGLPKQWVVAAGWEMYGLLSGADSVSIEADFPVSSDLKGVSMAGIEYAFTVSGTTLALRAGMKQGMEIPDGTGLTGGLGFRRSAGTFAWGLDYAYQSFGVFGPNQALALTVGFQPVK